MEILDEGTAQAYSKDNELPRPEYIRGTKMGKSKFGESRACHLLIMLLRKLLFCFYVHKIFLFEIFVLKNGERGTKKTLGKLFFQRMVRHS